MGADDYLSKPFNADELLVRAENLIQVRRMLRARFSEEVLPDTPADELEDVEPEAGENDQSMQP